MAENNKEKEILENESENITNKEDLNKIENNEKEDNKETEKIQIESKKEPKTEKNEESKEESIKEAKKETNEEKADKEKTLTEANNKQKEENKEEKIEKKENVKKFEPAKKEINTNNSTKQKNTKSKKEKKPKEKKSGKGTFTRLIAIVIILLAIIGLIYLAIPTPEKTLNNFFNSLKEGNIERINQYLNYEEISLEQVLNEGTEKNEVEKALFESLEWNIKSVTEEQDTATIEVEVTNKDYEKAFKSYIQEMFQRFLNNEDVSDEEQFELLINEISKEETGTKTTTQKITLVKENGKWKVTADDALTEALYPGLIEGIDSISNISLN